MDYHSVIFTPAHFLYFLLITPAATTILLFTVVILFFISFLVSGSEVAFFSLSTRDINMLKTRQQPSFRRIVTLLEHPKTLLASMLIANSLVNIGIILISSTLMNDWIESLGIHGILEFVLKVVVVSTLLVLFGEVLPKVWATHHKIWFASTASLLIEVFNSIFYSISKRLVKLSDGIEKSFNPSSARMDQKQLDYAIDLLPEHEATSEEKQILKGIRKFGNTTVKQIMRTRLDVSGIDHNLRFREVIANVEEMHYSRFPVYKNNLDELTGILHTKDLLPHIDQEGFDWHTLLRPVFYVHEQKLVEDILQNFREKRIHLAVVVDEFGGTSGIVTLEDVMEEIIGDIQDEFDDEQSPNKKLDDHTYIFEGKTMIHDVCKVLQIQSDTFDSIRGDSDSLAGLVLELAGEFPQINTSLEWGEYTFVPLVINRNRIESIKLFLKSENEAENT